MAFSKHRDCTGMPVRKMAPTVGYARYASLTEGMPLARPKGAQEVLCMLRRLICPPSCLSQSVKGVHRSPGAQSSMLKERVQKGKSSFYVEKGDVHNSLPKSSVHQSKVCTGRQGPSLVCLRIEAKKETAGFMLNRLMCTPSFLPKSNCHPSKERGPQLCLPGSDAGHESLDSCLKLVQ